ncbi:MAG: helix-turn-helix domain-containing protein [Candidatus Pacebacteria bacterium]|nr:helix-turn-helix domain-containing protein [Candidatus Paceibacterota bacterium]
MTENSTIELELRKLGLTEKEVRIYLAGLELGPNSVQNIAKTAKLARPTAYEIIKKLEEKKLFVETRQKGKRLFSAQSPENILGILRTQEREIEEKQREFIRIIAALEARYSKEKEGIRVFKGKESFKTLAETISFSSLPAILVVNPGNVPINSKELKKIYQAIKKRLGRVEIKETVNAKFKGSLIVFDKVVYFPSSKSEAFLIG